MHLQAREVYSSHQLPSARHLVDFIFTNTRLNLGVEVVLNLDAEGIQEHLQRKILQEYGVILHIDTIQSKPKQTPDGNSDDRIYTLLATQNELYRGSELAESLVARDLVKRRFY